MAKLKRFKKRILAEDRTYHSPDGELAVDSQRKQHWADKVNQFTAAGFDIPVFFDHQLEPDKAKPVKRKGEHRRRSKDQAGWLTGASVADDGALNLEFALPPDSAKHAEQNITKVSPVIWEKLKDGSGDTHEDVIGACDFVVHPVDSTQGDFEPIPEGQAVACSLYRMALDGNMQELEESGKDIEETEASTPIEELTEGDGTLTKVLKGLELRDIVLPDDTTEDNLLERLLAALMTAEKILGEEDDLMEEQQTEVAMLSLEQQQAIEDGKRSQLFAQNQHRESVAQRLGLLLEEGRVTPAEFEERKEQPHTIALSLDEEGKHKKTELEAWMESREAVPVGTFWDDETRTKKMSLTEEKAPGWMNGETVTDEEADAVADSVLKRK